MTTDLTTTTASTTALSAAAASTTATAAAAAAAAEIVAPKQQQDQEQEQPQWVYIVCFIVITIQLLRIAIDLIQYASKSAYGVSSPSPSTTTATATTTAKNGTSAAAATTTTTITTELNDTSSTTGSNGTTTAATTKETATAAVTTTPLWMVTNNYGTIHTTTTDNNNNNNNNNNQSKEEKVVVTDEEDADLEEMIRQPLIGTMTTTTTTNPTMIMIDTNTNFITKNWTLFVMWIWCCMAFVYVFIAHLDNHPHETTTTTTNLHTTMSTTTTDLIYTSSTTLVMEMIIYYLDIEQLRYGIVQRTLHLLVPIVLWCTYTILYVQQPSSSDSDIHLIVLTTIYVAFTILIGYITKQREEMVRLSGGSQPSLSSSQLPPMKKKKLSKSAIYILVKPYVWPDAVIDDPSTTTTTSTATFHRYGITTTIMNRFRAIMTWICVIISKYCSLICPLYLGWASTALAHGDYKNCIKYTIYYNVISWLSSTFKEGQSLMYLKVKQAAFVQLSQTAFGHLHTLSLDWHLRKKLGEVLRSMDRGITACDTLMNYVFLWLIPAIAECIAVCIIFASYFQYLPLGITVFYFVFVYIVWTLLMTVWRRKFRKALVLHDNEWHDRFTDSMINFETVKFFTAEQFEMERFASAVRQYQARSVDVQSSLSMLNISQQVILKSCLATALSLSALGIQKRVECCVETMGCDSGISECCLNISQKVCPGMQVGDFVAVLTYTLSLFAPLNFLGSVYNTIVMAMVDLGNMSELLAESPDVTDEPDAIPLPPTNITNPDVAIEFDNVFFNYPTQPKDRGLKGLSFTIKPGTTTAIVGPTGAGKTTVSRLLFRFYDVLGGAVKVNGLDVRAITQHSLRDGIGVVPQAASMFNDTIRSNILYGRRDATEAELVQAVTDAQLLEFIESLDEGWETLVGDRGLKLSGGEKQRAAIARCLLKNPPFILLDEATASLDTLTENSVQIALDRLGAQRTVVVIAHRLGTIRNADKIIVLKDGRAYEEGTHDELLLKNGLYAEMWNMQLHATSTTNSQSNLLVE